MLPWNPSPSYSAGHGPPTSQGGTNESGAQSGSYGYIAPNMTSQPGPSNGNYGQQQGQGSFGPYHGGPQQQGQQPQSMQQHQPLPPNGPPPQQPQHPQNGSMAGPSQLSPQAPPLQLSQVLHFLQTEYRRHERDRNEWEIERGEMRARIALLEGERRGSENLRADLLRRVKMLEFALRGERSKYLSTASAPPAAAGGPSTTGASAIPPAKAAMLKNEERAASPSGNSPPSDNDAFSDQGSQASQPNAASSAASAIPPHVLNSRPSSAASVLVPPGAAFDKGATMAGAGSTFGATMGGTAATASPAGWNPAIGRDPKGRARSRDYLKQCLQEIAYLTSPATINPLPDRTVEGLPRPPPKTLFPIPPPVPPQSAANNMPPPPPLVTSASPAIPTLARNAPDLEIIAPSLPSSAPMSTQANEYHAGPASAAMVPSTSSEGVNANPPPPNEVDDPASTGVLSSETDALAAPEVPDRPEQGGTIKPLVNGIKPHDYAEQHPRSNGVPWLGNGEERLTAIFRPESDTSWKEQLKAAGQRAAAESSATGDAELASLGLSDGSSEADDDEERRSSTMTSKKIDVEGGKGEPRTWRAKKTLKHHLDAVRCLAFDRADMTLASGSDDCTVKVWRLNPAQLAVNGGKTGGQPEVEPQHTFRGHSGPITALAISPASDRIYSASTDQTVQIWTMPSRDREQYGPYDESLRIARLEGHSDAIWSMALVPLRVRDEALLATASADGTVKVWSVDGPNGPALKLSWGYGGTDGESEGAEATTIAPTSVAVVHSDMRKLAVAYQDAVIKLFDIETGRELLSLRSDESYDGTPKTQVNMIVTHPTLPLLVSAHEDGFIRFFDLNSGACTHTVLAHTDAVTSVDIDPSGLALASTGHDNSVRFWDLLSTRTCVQEITAHRSKAGEGALAVKYHPNLPFLASGGADGIVKVYA